ncbi:MAG TPA: hypothetical protein VN851_07050 [Thermoanaerobaculia bacterium]|nr:hypothetical protein [Thermoanaerobaculia bacterium]
MVSPENEKLVRKKAELMMLRGVLRVFSVWVDRGEIREWNPESQSWREAATFHIEDPCLLVPLEAAALFDAEEADRAVLHALTAKGDPLASTVSAKIARRTNDKGLEPLLAGITDKNLHEEISTGPPVGNEAW